METQTAIRPAVAAPTGGSAPAPLPWDLDAVEPAMPAQHTRPAARPNAIRPRHAAAPVPWSVVALAALTAAIVTFSTQSGAASQTRELLPVMVMSAAP